MQSNLLFLSLTVKRYSSSDTFGNGDRLFTYDPPVMTFRSKLHRAVAQDHRPRDEQTPNDSDIASIAREPLPCLYTR